MTWWTANSKCAGRPCSKEQGPPKRRLLNGCAGCLGTCRYTLAEKLIVAVGDAGAERSIVQRNALAHGASIVVSQVIAIRH